MSEKIGLFAGTFDPVHQGHIDFVLAALAEMRLDTVIVVPEKSPRGKQSVSDLRHRKAMLELAFASHPNVAVRTIREDVAKMPETLRELAIDGDVYLLAGTDVVLTLKTWNNLSSLLRSVRFVVGVRSENDAKRIHTLMAHLGINPDRYTMIRTRSQNLSSSRARQSAIVHDPKIADYIQKHHLYGV